MISTSTRLFKSTLRGVPRVRFVERSLFSTASSKSETKSESEHPRTSILTNISDQPGSLHEVLRYFWKYDVNLTHIESRPCPKNEDGFHIYIDFDGRIGDRNVDQLMKEIKPKCKDMLILDDRQVPWFPRHISELDALASRCLDAGKDLEADHPGFSDAKYRARRCELASIANNYIFRDQIPRIQYTKDEIETWGTVYRKLQGLHEDYACHEYLESLKMLEQHCGYSPDNIPQAEDISKFLRSRTGFQLRPVTGLLSSRDFLNGLAFRSFFSTQYIRHSSMPLYTPEPDICHELLGHVPMFADPDFADFSQEIGLASLGASDADILKLATCYWFSVEFGIMRAGPGSSAVKAYGAGLLSSFGELEYSCKNSVFPPLEEQRRAVAAAGNETTKDAYYGSDMKQEEAKKDAAHDQCSGGVSKPKLLPWDPSVACSTPFPITTYQPTYFVAESLADAKEKMRTFCQGLQKPFYARYNPLTQSIWVDRAVKPSK